MPHVSMAKIDRAWGRYNRARRAIEKILTAYLTERISSESDILSADDRKIDSTLREMNELARAIKPLWFSVKAARFGWLVDDSLEAETPSYFPKDTVSGGIFIELADLYVANGRFVLRLMQATHGRRAH